MSQNSPFSKDTAVPDYVIEGDHSITSAKIAIVTARWNSDITMELEKGARDFLLQKGIKPTHVVRVPGAIEISLAVKHLLDLNVDAVITLGCVIRGETTHYEYVCNSVERGCTQLQIEYRKPVVSGILTVENVSQARDRIGGAHGHKGQEAAAVALEMVSLSRKLQS